MPEPIRSDEVRYGRNAETVPLKDSRYIRCSRCGFMCHLDRELRAPYGSTLGMGTKSAEVVDYDGGPDTDPVEYDGEDSEGRRVDYDGGRTDTEITGGCPMCGSYAYDKEEHRSTRQ